MEPESQAKGADLVGTEVSNHDEESSTTIRWIDDALVSDDDSNGDTPSADDADGNGAMGSDQLELGGPTERATDPGERGRAGAARSEAVVSDRIDADVGADPDGGASDDTPHSSDGDSDDDHDHDDDKAVGAPEHRRTPEVITISGGDSGGVSRDVSHLGAPDTSDDIDAWEDDDDWDDDDWDDETSVATDGRAQATPGPRAQLPEHLTFTDVLRVRSARVLAITMVVTFVAMVMATVLLWQRVEDTRAEVDRSHQITSVPGLADLRRRLNGLETKLAAVLASPNGDPTGRADALQQQLAALNQCVADFQHAVVSGTRSAVRYC